MICTTYFLTFFSELIPPTGKYNIQGQSSLLLELFFQEKDNGYTLKEDFIIEKLWPDNSGNDERMHKAIGRLRSFLRKIDLSLSIINKNGTYRLIISEKSLVKRNSYKC